MDDRPPSHGLPASDAAGLGERLAPLTQRLELFVAHLAGRAVLSRVEPIDLVQEVFLRALGARDVPPPEASDPGEARLFALMKTIARHTIIDAARAIRTRRRSGELGALALDDWSRTGALRASALASRSPGPATRLIGVETERRLVDAFRALSPEHRRVLGLRQFEGLSAAQAAQRMGRSEAAVHSLYRRALEAWSAAGGEG